MSGKIQINIHDQFIIIKLLFFKGLGELASWMANKGQGLMSEATWNEMHAEDAPDYDYMFYCKFKNNLSIQILH